MDIKDIIRNAREKLRVEELTPMQHKMAGLPSKVSAVALIAPTGSGKTLAFALAMLPRIAGSTGKVEGLVIAPTRELVIQIAKVLDAVAPGLRVTALYGGHSVLDESRSLEAVTPDIVVGTPGRILDHINRGRLDLYRVKVLVADEYDKSLELGFHDEMRRIVGKIRAPKLVVLTSATALDEQLPKWLGVDDLLKIDFSTDMAGAPRLSEHTVKSPEPDKLQTLKDLLLRLPHERTMVFVNHRESAERVYNYLHKSGLPAVLYHGALDQHDRENAIDIFANGTAPIMVATDLAARGLDIPQVESVVHYHMPSSPEARTHRNGRAARMGATGSVYYLVGPEENAPVEATVMGIGAVAPSPWPGRDYKLELHEERKEKLSKGDIVGALTGPGGLDAGSIGVIALHDHRALVAVSHADVSALAAALSAGRIKGKRIRVTPLR